MAFRLLPWLMVPGLCLIAVGLLRDGVTQDVLDLSGLLILSAGVCFLILGQRRHHRSLYRSLARSMPDMAVIQFDRELIIRVAEGPAFTTAGYDPAQLEGQHLADLIPAAYVHLIELYQAVLLGRSGSLEITISTGRTYLVHASQIRIGTAAGGMVIIQDVTEQRRLYAQLVQSQKMEGIGRLAGGIAHDFNNLLTAIQGISELGMLGSPANTQTHADFAEILAVARRAGTLTRQMLAFSRQQILSPRRMDLNTVVLESASLLRRLISEAVELSIVPDDRLPEVIVDPAQIEQVLVNLVVNARDALPTLGGRISITTGKAADALPAELAAGSYLTLTVSDTGAGMPPEVLAKAMEPFFTTKDPLHGTGLGLATCYGIVQQHGGTIVLDSIVAKGTTVTVYIPTSDYSPLPDRSEFSIASRPTPATLTYGTGSILLVEDDDAVRRLAHRTLTTAGYTVSTATNGQEALQVLRTLEPLPDLILTDVIMPLMTGPVMAEIVAYRYPDIRVIFMSGYTDNTITHAGVVDPGVRFLQKPFTAAVLSQKIAAAMEELRDSRTHQD